MDWAFDCPLIPVRKPNFTPLLVATIAQPPAKMRFEMRRPFSLLSCLAVLGLPAANAQNVLRSSSLAACQENSEFTASLFDVLFTPNNNTVAINMAARSTIQGFVIFDISIRAYGYQFIRTTIDPCEANLPGLCPMVSGNHNQPPFNLPVGAEAVRQIPGIAYTFPDLDATVRVLVNVTSGDRAGTTVACVEANISNGQTGKSTRPEDRLPIPLLTRRS